MRFERRPWSLLVLGLFFTILSWYPISIVQRFFAQALVVLQPMVRGMEWSNAASLPATTFANYSIPTLQEIAEKEAQFILPKNKDLLARRAVFAHLLWRNAQNTELILNAGSEDGVQVGMAAVIEDQFAGMITSVQAKQSILRLANHPDSRLAVISENENAKPFVAVGTGSNLLDVELISSTNFQRAERVILRVPEVEIQDASLSKSFWQSSKSLQAAQGAVLGKISLDSSQAQVSIAWFINPIRIQSVWLLQDHANPNPPKILLPQQPPSSRGRIIGPEISSLHHGLLVRLESPGELAIGSTVQAHGVLLATVEEVGDSFGLARTTNDPQWIGEIMFVGDGEPGAAGVFPQGQHSLTVGIDMHKMGSGWLLSGAGHPGVPKGLILARVEVAEETATLVLPAFPYQGEVEICHDLSEK